jgi:hypothetical protein
VCSVYVCMCVCVCVCLFCVMCVVPDQMYDRVCQSTAIAKVHP